MAAVDFAEGKVWKKILAQSIPLTLAQLVQLLYNVVDRVYLGHLEGTGGMALTGVGLTFPIITLIMAFTSLFGTGGSPLFAMERGAGDENKAQTIMSNVFSMLIVTSLVLIGICTIFEKPILYLFGASDVSYQYAHAYLSIYIIGTPFTMLTTGMNGFINAQGFPKKGMLTTIIGAVLNLILDPIFIFVFGMGVRGAALATIISQCVSAIWVLCFLIGKNALITISIKKLRPQLEIVKRVMALGAAGFIVSGTNAFVQIACNTTLHTYGGDLYVGIMTVINSVREVSSLPIGGICGGAAPVISFNYGAKKYNRVCDGIKFSATTGIIYTFLVWGLVNMIPKQLISLFTNEPDILALGVDSMKVYFFGFCFMAFQFAGQSSFQALGYAKQSIFFSLLRKAIIVVPLTFILPRLGMGVMGVFWAEPISNVIGGLASFLTMYFTVYRKLRVAANSEI